MDIIFSFFECSRAVNAGYFECGVPAFDRAGADIFFTFGRLVWRRDASQTNLFFRSGRRLQFEAAEQVGKIVGSININRADNWFLLVAEQKHPLSHLRPCSRLREEWFWSIAWAMMTSYLVLAGARYSSIPGWTLRPRRLRACREPGILVTFDF
jgi:hypothetical protein